MAPAVLVVAIFCSSILATARGTTEDKNYWLKVGQDELTDRLKVTNNNRQARNVVLFIGDGMGISTVTAGRIYKGQKKGHKGEDTKLNFEKFPFTAFSKTYTVDRQTSDSAGAGTAIASGVKANFGTLGFDARVKRRNCSLISDPNVRLETLLDWSLQEGKSVGIVTTARVTHATPAAMYAHSADRNWEREVPSYCSQLDIAEQLIKENIDINIIMGGGRRNFESRNDGKNLTNVWLVGKKEKGQIAEYITNADQLYRLDTKTTDSVLGLFTESHMTWEMDRDPTKEPSITEMTSKAIEILGKNSKGFFLLVEGARIDHGHHDNWAKRALEETVSMDATVGAVTGLVGTDTLIVVTADHSHPFNIVGYPKRGNNILGLVDPVDRDQAPTDNKPYSTLIYADGPGPNRTLNLSTVNMSANDFQFPRAVPMRPEWETHGGEDVGIFAIGPMAHLFTGTHEQNYVPLALAYASCVGPNKGHCKSCPSVDCKTAGAAGYQHELAGSLVLMLATFVMAIFNKI